MKYEGEVKFTLPPSEKTHKKPSLIRVKIKLGTLIDLNLPVQDEIWYADKFECAEFDGNVQNFLFEPQVSFLRKFGQKRYLNLNSIVMFTFSVWTEGTIFGRTSSKKSKLCIIYHRVWRFQNKADVKKLI